MTCKKCNYDGYGLFVEDELGIHCAKCHPTLINWQAPIEEIIKKIPDSMFRKIKERRYKEEPV